MRPRDQPGIVKIGDAHGRIALYLTETSAIDVAHAFGPSDGIYDEIMQAVERAYPKEETNEE